VTYDAPVHAVALTFEWGSIDEYMWLPLTVPLAAARLADPNDRQHWDPYWGRELAEAHGLDRAQDRLAADPELLRLAGELVDVHSERAERAGSPDDDDELYDAERYALMVIDALDADPPPRWGFEIVEPFELLLVTGESERFELLNLRRTGPRRGRRPRPIGS
jgi:hypothetical protein